LSVSRSEKEFSVNSKGFFNLSFFLNRIWKTKERKKNKDKKGANNAIVFVQLETLASSKHYDFFFLFLSKAS